MLETIFSCSKFYSFDTYLVYSQVNIQCYALITSFFLKILSIDTAYLAHENEVQLSFVSSKADLCSAAVITILCVISWHIVLHYNGTALYFASALMIFYLLTETVLIHLWLYIYTNYNACIVAFGPKYIAKDQLLWNYVANYFNCIHYVIIMISALKICVRLKLTYSWNIFQQSKSQDY